MSWSIEIPLHWKRKLKYKLLVKCFKSLVFQPFLQLLHRLNEASGEWVSCSSVRPRCRISASVWATEQSGASAQCWQMVGRRRIWIHSQSRDMNEDKRERERERRSNTLFHRGTDRSCTDQYHTDQQLLKQQRTKTDTCWGSTDHNTFNKVNSEQGVISCDSPLKQVSTNISVYPLERNP